MILCAISHLLVTHQNQMCPFRQETHSLLVLIFRNHPIEGRSFDSSVGRAEDCRECEVILRSLVRIRLEGHFLVNFFFEKIKFQAYVLLVNYFYYYNEPVKKSPYMLNLSASEIK